MHDSQEPGLAMSATGLACRRAVPSSTACMPTAQMTALTATPQGIPDGRERNKGYNRVQQVGRGAPIDCGLPVEPVPQHAQAAGLVQRRPQLGVVEGVRAEPWRALLLGRGALAAPPAARLTRPCLLLVLRMLRGGPVPLPFARLHGGCVVGCRVHLIRRSSPAAGLAGSGLSPWLLLRLREVCGSL